MAPKLPLLRFAHEAMATRFEIILCEEDEAYARQAAREVFAELDRLEDELSRFRESSDAARLRFVQPGDTLRLGVAAFECLRLAAHVHSATGGAFDPTVGPLVDWWRTRDASANIELDVPAAAELAVLRERVGMDLLELDDNEVTVRVARAGVSVDFGAVGKGYAVDAMAGLLREWSIGAALIHGGQSSIYALGSPPCEIIDDPCVATTEDPAPDAARSAVAPGWRVAIRRPGNPGAPPLGTVLLRDCALSGSGTAFHGGHIIDPRTGRPGARWAGTWAIAPTAAESDALSTAFMLMSREEIETCRAQYKTVDATCIITALAATDTAHPILVPFGPINIHSHSS